LTASAEEFIITFIQLRLFVTRPAIRCII